VAESGRHQTATLDMAAVLVYTIKSIE